MSEINSSLRILLISQWPNVKNGEYELIEKIKQTGYKIAVVDYFGFDVTTGECLNRASLIDNYDFAISFHYDTPKFIDIPTYLWVANPLEFMHLRGDYRNVLMHHLRSYDDYLYNGSDTLKAHIKRVVGSKWMDSGLEMFPSCATSALTLPTGLADKNGVASRKIFYCGVNWERGIDRAGRAQGLLDILQQKQVAEFYGPDKLEGISPWAGFTSYKGEIPFDGVTMTRVMREYGAVLAVSSPAHMKSRTSSSRVFEGIAAGVPVISDENPHVRRLFGDLVYYFKGETEEERAATIIQALSQIIENPKDAEERVVKAQQIMASRMCFDPCFERILKVSKQYQKQEGHDFKQVDIFLFHHDPDPLALGGSKEFNNFHHILRSAAFAAQARQAHVRVIYLTDGSSPEPSLDELPANVEVVSFNLRDITDENWDRLRLGEKITLLSNKANADFVTFFTQFDFPHYDYFTKSLDWFAENELATVSGIHVGGFFINDLMLKAPLGTADILRNNTPSAMYQWTQNSFTEHQLAMITFSRGSLALIESDKVARFDSILPVVVIASAISSDLPVHRSRHIVVRVQYSHFKRHYEAYTCAASRGFWAQHYDLVTNYNHELNALYDLVHESPIGTLIADKVSGHALLSMPPIDPAVHVVNQFISRLRPLYRLFKKVRNVLQLKKK
ncbi:hypothetical protein GALL_74880 [mine drainage metagenome]|uniref:Spore protein YkvP/CgeB glycosyl transferase-like domain-containing protein n=1 Tax=mine drainage metagenome TaxID=410659 RepID=A0A1J5TF90_9ZZZZ